MPPTYLGVGHGYRWNPGIDQYRQLWQSQDRDPVILWRYESGQIVEETRGSENQAHWSDTDNARGRIETGANRGSIQFNSRPMGKDRMQTPPPVFLQRRILKDLVDKYPGIEFGVYEQGGPYRMQEYWDKLEGN